MAEASTEYFKSETNRFGSRLKLLTVLWLICPIPTSIAIQSISPERTETPQDMFLADTLYEDSCIKTAVKTFDEIPYFFELELIAFDSSAANVLFNLG